VSILSIIILNIGAVRWVFFLLTLSVLRLQCSYYYWRRYVVPVRHAECILRECTLHLVIITQLWRDYWAATLALTYGLRKFRQWAFRRKIFFQLVCGPLQAVRPPPPQLRPNTALQLLKVNESQHLSWTSGYLCIMYACTKMHVTLFYAVGYIYIYTHTHRRIDTSTARENL